MNLYKQINEWLLGYTPLNNWIYFNATPFIVGSTTVNSISGARVTKEFVDGSKRKEILFAVDFIGTYDASGTSDVNMDTMQEAENFANWIETQTTFPDFGSDCTIEKIEVLTSTPNAYVNESQGLAKYQFQAKITYTDESEVN